MLGAISASFVINVVGFVSFVVFVLPIILGLGYIVATSIADLISYLK